MSLYLPLMSARPGSVVCTVAPGTHVVDVALHRNVYSGMSGVRRDASVRPMLSGATMEWLPPLGVSWHVAHEPTNESGSGGLNGEPTAPLSPPTPEIVMGKLLKRSPPRAMARRGRAARGRRPRRVRREHVGIEGRPRLIVAEVVVDAVIRELIEDRRRAAASPRAVEAPRVVVPDLCGGQRRLEGDDRLALRVAERVALGVAGGRAVRLIGQVDRKRCEALAALAGGVAVIGS